MIHVRRNSLIAPSILFEKKGPAATERKRAEEHFTKPPPKDGKKSFKFAIYKDDGVKAALHRLFQGKCAYCESYYAATQPVDIEHSRPKAIVIPENWEEDKEEQPGYYWLASDWDNLLPSCIDCNRAREQTDVAERRRRVLGKASRFPIAAGSQRAKNRKDLKNEQPLLLNPCTDNPREHIACGSKDPSIIVPVNDSKKGTTSIEVYGLNRGGLVVGRRERLSKIRLHMYRLVRLNELQESSDDKRLLRILDELINAEIRTLMLYRRKGEPYAMMARQVTDEYLRANYGEAPD